MADSPAAILREQLLADLTELVRALDRRTPALASAGEVHVAKDAAALKLRAMQRITQLESER